LAERLVDVVSKEKNVLHTFPITIGNSDTRVADAAFEEKASKAAGYANLVPNDDLDSLATKMHVSRSGPLEPPYGDKHSVSSQTKAGLDRIVCERAYFLWRQEGCPDGMADEHWHSAQKQHLNERAYGLWEQKGRQDGNADQDWHETRAFEAY